MIRITRLSTRGQLVVPRDIRAKLKLKPGTILVVTIKKGVIELKPFQGS